MMGFFYTPDDERCMREKSFSKKPYLRTDADENEC